MTNRGRGILVASVIVASALCRQVRAQDESDIRPLQTYQIQSQYGPEVAVLNPIFDKENKFEFNLGAAYSPLSSLYDYYGIEASLTYHLNRRHAIEPIWFQYNFGSLSTFAKSEIADKTPVDKKKLGADLPRIIVASNYVFTPYYAKMHLTDASVVHVDFFALIGVAAVYTESLLLNDSLGEKNWRFGGDAGLGFRVLFGNRWGARFEVRDFLHPAKQIGADELTNDIQASLSMSFFFPSFKDYSQL